MNYYTRGKIYERGPITEGMSSTGNRWQRMTLVIEVAVGQYTKKMAFQVMTGNVPAVMAFKDGDMVDVGWDIVSREWTNKDGIRSWFTQADLRDIKAADMIPAVNESPAVTIPASVEEDDLPFGNE